MTKQWATLWLAALSAWGTGCSSSYDSAAAAGPQLLAPDGAGWVDRSTTGTTGIQGPWRAFADSVANFAGLTAGSCQSVAYGECSTVREPAPDGPYGPTAGLGMCTSGVIAKWIATLGSQGITPDGSSGRAGIVLDLNTPDWPEPHGSPPAPAGQPYDADAHRVAGFAFDLDSEPDPGAKLRVEVAMLGGGTASSPSTAAFWGGAHQDASPVHAGHNEFRWSDVGPPPFSPNRILSLAFVVSGNEDQPVSYDFCIDHLTALRSSGGAQPAGGSSMTPDDQLLLPNETGWVARDTTGTTEIQGPWYAASDAQGACPQAGHTACSIISEPDPAAPTFPPTPGLGMCTSGIVAQGGPAYDGIWGAMIGFLFNVTGEGAIPYDAEAHGVTGVGFDIDSEPAPGAELSVKLETEASHGNDPSWGGETQAFSPVHAGHNEFQWKDVGGPSYMPQAFDPRHLMHIAFVVPPNPEHEVSFRFCIQNLTALRH